MKKKIKKKKKKAKKKDDWGIYFERDGVKYGIYR